MLARSYVCTYIMKYMHTYVDKCTPVNSRVRNFIVLFHFIRKLWKLLDNSATLLSKVCDSLSLISKDNYMMCKKYIFMQSWKYAHQIACRAKKNTEREVILGVSGINGPTAEDFVLLPGDLTL